MGTTLKPRKKYQGFLRRIPRLPLHLFLIFLPVMIVLIFSCSNYNNPVMPENENKAPDLQDRAPNFLRYKSTDLGKRSSYKFDYDHHNWLTERKFIKRHKGGKVGGKRTRNNCVIIPPLALRTNLFIYVSVPKKSDYIFVEFGPHYNFDKKVKVEISYKNANLKKVNEDNLAIWYIDDGGVWTKITNSVVDKRRKVVIALVYHFSRYGLSDD